MKINYIGRDRIQIKKESGEVVSIIAGSGVKMDTRGNTLSGNFAVVAAISTGLLHYEEVRIFCHEVVPEGGGAERTYMASFYPFDNPANTLAVLSYLKDLTFERALSLCKIFDNDFDFEAHLEPCDMEFINCCPVDDDDEYKED